MFASKLSRYFFDGIFDYRKCLIVFFLKDVCADKVKPCFLEDEREIFRDFTCTLGEFQWAVFAIVDLLCVLV